MTEAYESENLVYLPTRAIEQVSSKRSYLSNKGQKTANYVHTAMRSKFPFKEKKNKSGKNKMGGTII